MYSIRSYFLFINFQYYNMYVINFNFLLINFSYLFFSLLKIFSFFESLLNTFSVLEYLIFVRSTRTQRARTGHFWNFGHPRSVQEAIYVTYYHSNVLFISLEFLFRFNSDAYRKKPKYAFFGRVISCENATTCDQ